MKHLHDRLHALGRLAILLFALTALTDIVTAADDTKSAEATDSTAAYRRAMNRAVVALQSRDPATARQQLTTAASAAQTDAQRDRVRQLQALSEQLSQFMKVLAKGLQQFEPAEQLQAGDEVASIVQVGSDGISLFIERERRDFTLATLPARYVAIIARAAATEDAPAAKLFWGAFYAVDPPGDRQRASRLWEAAGAAGLKVDLLLPCLEAGALAIEREAVPNTSRVAEAEKAAAEELAAETRAAKTASGKLTLAASYLSAAHAADDPLEQFACLRQSARWAQAGGDPAAALAAIDEQARWFDVDALELKSELLAQLPTTLPAPAAKRTAELALRLSSEATTANRPELAQSLAATALIAARKARDPDLIKQAAGLRNTAKQPVKSSRKADSGND